MALASLGAISSILVAGPSGTKKSKSEEKPASDKKQNPFDTKPIELSGKKPAVLRKNFNEDLLKTKKLTLSKAVTADDVDEYSYNPYIGGGTPETCGQFRAKFGIPEDYPITVCQGDDNRIMAPTKIKAEDLENFVGIKSKNK